VGNNVGNYLDSSSGFVPQGALYGWNPELVWLNALSDALIALAFFSIAVLMLYLFRRRTDRRFTGLVCLFAAFVACCGLARGLAAWNVWHSAYWLETIFKTATAAISLATAAVLIKMAPVIVRMALPEEVEQANVTLRREMTETENAYQQRIESERSTLRSYFEGAVQGIVVVSRTGRMIMVNRRTEEMFGYAREELLGQELEMLLPRRLRHTHAGHRHEFFLDPSMRQMGEGRDLAGLRKDGTEFPVEIGLSFTGSGENTVALGLVSDITDRKRAEDALAKSHAELRAREAELRSYLEAAAQAILAVDEEGRIVLVNQRTEEIFGYSREELLGQPLELLLPERYRAAHAGLRSDFLRMRRTRRMGSGMELAARRKDGSEVPVEIGLSFVETPQGALSLSMITDITERKRAADELARLNEQLRQSNSDLEQFAYIASHDLQEPLRMVTSYLNLLELRYRDKLDTEAGEFIRYAIDGAERMKGLIRDVLRFSRAGTREVTLREVESGQALEQAMENLQATIEERGARIIAGNLPRIRADANMLAHVFQNLIGNGIKFTKQATPEISIAAERRGAEWVFSVGDHGIGIEPRHLDRIFVIFERLNPNEEYAGTGVGLAICKRIIERHHGRIWVESKLGQGSTFYFSLPAEIAASTPEKSSAKA